MQSPKSKKEVQSLTGKLAALTRFLSKAAEKSLPFFLTLKNSLKKSDFKWTEEAEKTFLEMKAFERIAYFNRACSGRNINDVQMPVYFVSKALSGSEVNYTPIEKLVYTLVHTARRLRRYFQAHTIVVLTDQPIKKVLYKPEVSGDWLNGP
ncbi:uncharacterized protein [Rutidosis leptorrhynchoides]|uniref:uncharacterized protein n=1 Tax=Rutidosis leptorrhynchoides TaxID=125765 RepID=UPI003A996FE1